MLHGHFRDKTREFLLPDGDKRRVSRGRAGSDWFRRRLREELPGTHPAGHAALQQQSQTAGIGFQQRAVLEEVAADGLITLRAELRWSRRQFHGDA